LIVFYPLSLLVRLIVWCRETLYSLKVLPSYRVKTKVVSVGNLTFGGTGKTPSVDFLVQNLKVRKKIAVLSRGYGRTTTGFFKVDPTKEDAAKLFGDEPVQLALAHPDVSFFVCEDRVEGCRRIESEQKYDLILADDAFQHLRLRRDLDIVVIDATEERQHYHYPPVGRARNSLSYLKRADFVFLTKTNLCRAEDSAWIRDQLNGRQIIEFESQIEGIYDLGSGEKIISTLKQATLVSGIGKPHTFEKLIKKMGVEIKQHFVFPDHYNYTELDLQKISGQVSGEIVLTTEKDAVKLKKISKDLRIGVVKLKFVNKNSVEKLYEAIY
jgi:tetraacyldisaccharide 4'-kinase